MDSFNIKLDGINPVKDSISRVQQRQGLKTGIRAGAIYLKGKVSVYPKQNRRKQPFKTIRQQKGFFAKLKSGEIEVPYFRGINKNSERLAQRWTTDIRDDGLTGVVGNNASYAKLVHSKKDQAMYHKKGDWKTTDRVARDESKKVKAIVAYHVEKDLKR